MNLELDLVDFMHLEDLNSNGKVNVTLAGDAMRLLAATMIFVSHASLAYHSLEICDPVPFGSLQSCYSTAINA